MPVQTACPLCRTTYVLADDQVGKTVRCKNCQQAFLVGSAPRPTAPSPRAARTASTESRIQTTPARAGRREEPGRRSPPASTAKKGGSGRMLLVGGLVALALVLLMCVPVGLLGVGWLMWSWTSSQPVAQNQVNTPTPLAVVTPMLQPGDNAARPPLDQPVKNPPPDPGPRAPAPASDPPVAAGNGQLSAEVLAKVKRATVHLRVTLASGQVAQGTGFFGVQRGIILTNAHVMGMLQPESRRPLQIEATMNGGKEDEKKFPVQLLDVDRSSDLAVLRADVEPMPEPLEVRSARNLQETQKVFVFGFPFGDQLGKSITVSESSVSSLREENGVLHKVQVNGGMQPGNSGGPVVDTHGDVIGVAVSGIVSTQINFAVPGDYVHVILNGRISGMSVGQAYFGAGNAILVPVSMQMIDPLNRIQEVALEVWTGNPGQPRLATRTRPTAEAGDSPHERQVLTYNQGQARGEVTFPALPDGEVYWVQPTWINGNQQPQWASASIHRLALPVRREPANLTLHNQQANRQLTLKSKNTFKLRDGEDDHSLMLNMETVMAENVVNVTPQWAETQLRYGKFELGVSLDGKGPPRNERLQHIMQDIGKLRVLLRVDGQGNLLNNQVDVNQVPVNSRKDLQEMNEQIQMSLESLAVPLPNREVAVGESWKAWRNLPLNTPNSFENGAVEMTYTYQGKRTRNGRDEAVLSLSGVVHGRKGQELRVGGRASGSAVVDLATGQVAEAQLSLQVDMEVVLFKEPARATGTLESQLQRTLP